MESHELRLYPYWLHWDNWLGADKIPFPIIWIGNIQKFVNTIRFSIAPFKTIEEHIANALSHEILHLVLDEVDGERTADALDEIVSLHWELFSILEGWT